MNDETEAGCGCLTLIALSVVIPAWIVIAASMESSTYNKLTGAKTTWWDALWVELRVTP